MPQSNQKQTPIPVVPRNMQIVNADGTVTRSGQLLLEQLQKTSSVSYGAAGDLANATDIQDGAIFVVHDLSTSNASELLYQYQDGDWHYIAGTMWGTLQPDQRPVGLGVNDAGLDFRSVDTDPRYGGREFFWSGSIWIEVTPIRWGTHADRLASGPVSILAGTLWVETDRDNVVYQVQVVSGSHAWVYVTGTMADSLGNLPGDLGPNDIDFLFATSDTLELYRWSGVAWVNQTPANAQQIAYSVAVTTLTTTPQDIGVSITLARAGRYALTGFIDFRVSGAGDVTALLLGQIVEDGTADPKLVIFGAGAATDAATVGQQWTYTAPAAGKIAKLQAWKTAGTGGSFTAGHCSLSAVWLGP